MPRFFLIYLILVCFFKLFAQSAPPKREFRAAWIATVVNLDWPSSNMLSASQQQQELINLLNELKRDGINTVLFQIRSECDAMYSSSFDPWSFWLTGSQGTAPYPFYDPLEFAIEEAHKRGMELHVWFNPYRAERSVGNYSKAPNHVTVQHPDWVLHLIVGTSTNLKFLDPGLQTVRDYVSSVVYDVVSRYDVDGVHFDDYFYPYEGIGNLDAQTFINYPRGFTSIANWRRDNVNLLIAQVNDTIQSVKPWVKFGISPFGIWKNGIPPGITGLSAYDDIYCDAIAWLHNRSIDYLTPQLYWPFGGGQDYAKLQKWWADSVYANNRHFYPGHAYYRIPNWTNPSEMPNQIRFDRNNPKVQGSVFFRSKNFPENPKGVTDSLRNDLYRYISILPTMNWKDVVPPNPPQNLRFERLANGQGGLHWDLPQIASDGDSASRYVIYRFDHSNIQVMELDYPENILNVEGNRFSITTENNNIINANYFIVTSLDRNYNESNISNVIEIESPSQPLLSIPINNSINVLDTVVLKWEYPQFASTFRLQISKDDLFDNQLVLDESKLIDTLKLITGLEGQCKYYWRVSASNIVGTSEFSPVFNFSTGFPPKSNLLFPPNNASNIPTDTILYWKSTPVTETYSLQVARSIDFSQNSLIVNAEELTDTFYIIGGLEENALHFWKVKGVNQYGHGQFSDAWRFRIVNPSGIDDVELIPDEYSVEQNYPNPFNPVTNIRVRISHAGFTTLKVYNLLGQEVATLVEDFLNPGVYLFKFDSQLINNSSSGVYFYRLSVNGFTSSRKMILLK